MDAIEVQTEPNFDGQYDEYFKRVKVKQIDDISAEVEDEKNVDVICRLVSLLIIRMKSVLGSLKNQS